MKKITKLIALISLVGIICSCSPSSSSAFSSVSSNTSSNHSSDSSLGASSSSSSNASSGSSLSSSSSSTIDNGDITISDEAGTYYNSINFSQTPSSLKTALSKLVNSGTSSLSYNDLWSAFHRTDVKDNGEIWDMYSNVKWKKSNQCGSYRQEGDCFNREHSVPKSWFDSKTPAYTDLFHLYPTDGKVNGMRSNYPFGKVEKVTYTSGNGSKLGYGTAKYGYTDIVFEPIDEYKGDFARTYFYFVTRYEGWDIIKGGGKVHFAAKAGYPGLTQYSITLLLDWNDLDPVSPKEINRNNIIYTNFQHNRNPFIDISGLADYLWENLLPV